MRLPKIDLLSNSKENFKNSPLFAYKQKNFALTKRAFFAFVAILGIGSGVFYFSPATRNATLDILPKKSFIGSLVRLVTNRENFLAGEEDGRTNILILGIGGAGHDGPNLADTLLLASLDTKKRQAALLSIPRDLVVPTAKYGQRKINAVNALAEQESSGSGGEATARVLELVLGVSIHYYARVDFSGFKTLIDDLGGLDIFVERSFTDPFFPTKDGGVTRTLIFSRGWEKMNGARALEFVRSRHGTNGEGSDFARNRRQQKVLRATEKKIFSLGVISNPYKLKQIINILSEHVKTNIEVWEALRWAQIWEKAGNDKINGYSLETGPEGLLVDTIAPDGAYILLPKENDWGPIQNLVARLLTPSAPAVTQKLRVEIQNGTRIAGLAAQTAELMSKLGYSVVKIGNAPIGNASSTIIYDLANGFYSDKLQELSTHLKSQISLNAPEWFAVKNDSAASGTQESAVDFLIVLGHD